MCITRVIVNRKWLVTLIRKRLVLGKWARFIVFRNRSNTEYPSFFLSLLYSADWKWKCHSFTSYGWKMPTSTDNTYIFENYSIRTFISSQDHTRWRVYSQTSRLKYPLRLGRAHIPWKQLVFAVREFPFPLFPLSRKFLSTGILVREFCNFPPRTA